MVCLHNILMRQPLSLLPSLCVGLIFPLFLPVQINLCLALSVATLSLLFTKKYPFVLHLMIFSLAITYGSFRADIALANRLPLEKNRQTESMTIVVRDLPQTTTYSTRFQAEILTGSPLLVGKKIIVNDFEQKSWATGSIWSVSMSLRVPVDVVNSVGFNTEAWYLSEGIGAIGNVKKGRSFLGISTDFAAYLGRLRESLVWRIDRVGRHYPRGAQFLAALTIGKQSGISQNDWQAFRATGITHLVSISGLHVTMVALFMVFLAKNIMCVLPPRRLYPKTVMLIVGVLAALTYAVLAGFSVPTQRSVFMLATAALMVGSRQYFTPWQVCWGSLSVVLLIDPFAALAVGFWLSFGLVASLVWVGANRRKPPQNKWLLGLKAQSAATVASVVPLGLFFGQLPLLSPLVNTLAIPWVSWVLTPFSLIALVLPFDLLLEWACALCELSLNVLDHILPFAWVYPVAHAPWLLISLALFATLLILAPKGLPLKGLSLLVLVLFIVYPNENPKQGEALISVLDVGQGLSVLVQTQNHTLLFDTGAGSGDRIVLPVLRGKGVTELSALILSHHDTDHDQGLPEIIKSLPVHRILAGQSEVYPDLDVKHCDDEVSWFWDGVYFEWLTPATFAEDKNDTSCVLRVLVGKEAFLVTGDLSKKGEEILVNSYQKSIQSQVLVLGHHGSRTSSGSLFLRYVAPEYVIISAGFANRYRHPNAQVLSRVTSQAQVWRTDRQGAILVRMGHGITVKQEVMGKPFWQLKPFDSE